NFYSVLKDADPYLKFCFLTGVSKFAKVSIFSGLNNLKDITLLPAYATICGYTQEELENTFADRIKDVDLDKVKLWYNGYSWHGERVYNPFDVLLFLDSKFFRPYWFETGTPTFLIKLILEEKFNLARLEHLEVGDELLESFDVGVMYPETILFQTGYLTLRDVKMRGTRLKYLLSYPNLEVKISFNNFLLNFFNRSLSKKEEYYDSIYDLLEAGRPEGLEGVFKSIFSGIPHDWFRKNNLEEYEGFYASVFYAYFCGLGVDVRVEDVTNQGRLDMAVLFEDRCYLFEFKVVDKSTGSALSQLKEKKYWEKYQDRYKEIYLIGIEFGKRERNILDFRV
ncbi:MAG: AAA family ATPase, partial [Desulfonauticus sp.]|nr:AAA family ATPase [Desulfonauticus sp.]